MKQTKVNFQNVAVLCDTWQQMLHLAELAREIAQHIGKGLNGTIRYAHYEMISDVHGYWRAISSYRSLLRSKQINSRVINLVRV